MLKSCHGMVGAGLIGLATLGGATAASAQPKSRPPVPAPSPRPTPEGSVRLSICEIVARVEAQGYRDIEEIEREGGNYEVEAKDSQGRSVELKVNGTSGDVEDFEFISD